MGILDGQNDIQLFSIQTHLFNIHILNSSWKEFSHYLLEPLQSSVNLAWSCAIASISTSDEELTSKDRDVSAWNVVSRTMRLLTEARFAISLIIEITIKNRTENGFERSLIWGPHPKNLTMASALTHLKAKRKPFGGNLVAAFGFMPRRGWVLIFCGNAMHTST